MRRNKEAVMTSKTEFTDEEWTRLKRAPFVAGMAISLADPGGPIEAVKETSATLKEVLNEARGGGRGELVEAIARDVEADARARKSPLAGFRPSKGTTAGVEILDELRQVNRLVAEKATADEAAAVRAWLLAAAQAAANAAKEGGFMGFHAERVSEGEQRMLDMLGEALAAPRA
jgi:broad specificity phosphatase PhoE